ncbi:MAG: OmpA family protein [Proteobacteria bacterium]|nr:OmpA family protein [Pseudomonadota bacterium]
MTIYRSGLIAVGALFGLASGAMAQSGPSANPSVDQIIGALKPPASALHGPTRGIHPLGTNTGVPSDVTPAATGAPAAKPKAAAPATTASAAAPVPAAPAALPSIDLYVLFANDSAELTPEAMATLDKLGAALSSNALSGYRFKIEGHTDTTGTETHNMTLSERRAQAVSAYLEKKFAVNQGRLEVVGMGERDLLVQTPPNTPEPRNRRVKVVNIGA